MDPKMPCAHCGQELFTPERRNVFMREKEFGRPIYCSEACAQADEKKRDVLTTNRMSNLISWLANARRIETAKP